MDRILANEELSPPTLEDVEIALDTNEVIVQGRIVHLYKSNGFVNITVHTGISGRRGFESYNYPDCVCFGDLAETVGKDLKENDFVKIKGHMRARRRNPRSTVQAKHFKWQEICADEITKVTSIMDEEMPMCKIKLTGTLLDMRCPSDGIVSLFIGVRMPNNQTYRIMGSYFTRDAAAVLQQMKVGDKIACIGTMESRKSKSGYHENFVIRNYQIEQNS